jgi:hypothetical protein
LSPADFKVSIMKSESDLFASLNLIIRKTFFWYGNLRICRSITDLNPISGLMMEKDEPSGSVMRLPFIFRLAY